LLHVRRSSRFDRRFNLVVKWAAPSSESSDIGGTEDLDLGLGREAPLQRNPHNIGCSRLQNLHVEHFVRGYVVVPSVADPSKTGCDENHNSILEDEGIGRASVTGPVRLPVGWRINRMAADDAGIAGRRDEKSASADLTGTIRRN
jgi:hypothetical protein